MTALFWVLFAILSIKCVVDGYFVDERQNCSNVFSAADGEGPYVQFLGTQKSTKDCIAACLNYSTPNGKCQSYTYMSEEIITNDYKQHCYGRFGKQYGLLWIPIPQQNVTCGRIIYQCTSDLDCELNGKCDINTGNCTCRAGWSGYHCQSLNLLSSQKGSGYHITNDNNSKKPTSSWGGAILVDPNDKNDDTKYHMYLSEFNNHCGVHSWTLNSVVTHAQSTKGWNSAYERVEVLHEAFAHEVDAINGPNSEIVLYYSSYNYTDRKECICSDGSTPPTCSNDDAHFMNIMDWSPSGSPNGPWKRTVIFPMMATNVGDTNLAGVIAKNGTFVGMMRYWNDGSLIHLVTSSDWKDGSKYEIAYPLLFPQLIGWDVMGTEDQFLYFDCDGNYHAIFHNMDPFQFNPPNGAHAYSEDGINWIYGGSSWGNVVEFTDGTSFTFPRLERPHLIFADDGCTPIALTNGVFYGGQYGDAAYTLVQPIAH